MVSESINTVYHFRTVISSVTLKKHCYFSKDQVSSLNKSMILYIVILNISLNNWKILCFQTRGFTPTMESFMSWSLILAQKIKSDF